jgi:ribosome-associated protein
MLEDGEREKACSQALYKEKFRLQNQDTAFDEKLANIIAAAQDKKADNVVAFDFRLIEGAFCDAFVICSGLSDRQVEAIVENIEETMKDSGWKLHHIEGKRSNHWVLMDYGDVIVHVFQDRIREFYRLENLWNHAPRIYPGKQD